MIDARSVLDLARAALDEILTHAFPGAHAVPDDDLCSRGPACGNLGRGSCTAVLRCNRGDRCLDAVELNVKTPPGKKKAKVGAPAARPLCDHCERAVAQVLAEVPKLYLDLENALPPGTVPLSGGSRRKITGSPLGINGRAVHLQETVHQLLTTWEDAVRDTAGLSTVLRQDEDPWETLRPAVDRPRPKRRARASTETVAAAKLLGAYLTAWIVHLPVEYAITRSTADPDDPKAKPTDDPQYVTQAGWEAAAALIDWKHQVRATIGMTTPAVKRAEPCMYCEVKAVVEEAGHAGYDQIHCRSCNRSWPRHEYLAKVRGFEPYLRSLAKTSAPKGSIKP